MTSVDSTSISQDQAKKFATEVLNSLYAESTEFPTKAWQLLGEFGLYGMPIHEDFGGLGISCTDTCSVLEALGASMDDQGLLHAACTQILCAVAIDRFGSENQRQRYLPQICNGSLICAQALTEPNAGSNLAEISSQAILNNQHFVLNGSKVFTSNAPVADIILVFCVTNPERKNFGRMSCLIVEADLPGLSKGKPMAKMGLDSLQNGELFFDDCKVPEQNLLGKLGAGDSISNEVMSWERIILFATMVGKQQRIIDECIEYTKSRKQGGQSISKYQAVSHTLATMKVNHYLSSLAVNHAAEVKDLRKSAMLESSICKLFVSESLKAASLNAIQLRGGYGYMKEYGAEKDVRDSLASTIYSGTSEIQRNIIARLMGL